MSKNLTASAHWLILGLILIAFYVGGRALTDHYVSQSPMASYPVSFYSEIKVPFNEGDDLAATRVKAYQQSSQKAADMAALANKKVGKLTGVNENINDNPSAMGTMEATPGAKIKEYILGLTFELN
jgi:hypothetical protein